MTFPERLERARARRHLSKSELAEAAGITPSTYGNYVHPAHAPRRTPTPEIMRKLAQVLGTTVDWLTLGEGDFEAPPEKGNSFDKNSVTTIKVLYGGVIPAGEWERPEGERYMVEAEVPLSIAGIPGLLMFTVGGDSLKGITRKGQKVFVKPTHKPLDGKVTAFRDDAGNLNLKIARFRNGSWVMCNGDGDSVPMGVPESGRIDILGIVVLIQEADPDGISA